MDTPLTVPQQKALAKIVAKRLPLGHTGFERLSWERVAAKLCTLGMAEPYVHGGYVATDVGVAQHRANIAHAEAETSRCLGNGREAEEKSKRGTAERWFAAAQKWLDLANDLRSMGW